MVPASADAGRAGRLIAAAQAALSRGDGVEAQARLREARAAAASDDAVRAAMGEALLAQNDLAQARRWLAPARFSADTQAQGFWTLGRLELFEGRLAEAGRAFDRALAIAPRDPRMWTDVARLRLAGGERAQAIAAVQHALAIDPSSAEALAFRGVLVREQFGPAASLAWFDAALAVAPRVPAYLADRAATLGELGRAGEALRDARELPGDPRSLYLQAVIAARGGERALARRLLERGGERLRDRPGALLLAGALALDAGNHSLAVAQLDRLLRLQPGNRLAPQLLARALARSGDAAGVVEQFAPITARADASPYLLTLVARAYEDLGRRDAAVPLLARAAARPSAALVQIGTPPPAATSGSGSPGALLAIGDAAMVRADRAGALSAYLASGSLRFGERELFRIERALRLIGRHDDADRTLSAFAAQNPRNPAVVRALANAAAARRQWREAARLLAWLDREGGGRDAALLADWAFAAERAGQRSAARGAIARAAALQPARDTVRAMQRRLR